MLFLDFQIFIISSWVLINVAGLSLESVGEKGWEVPIPDPNFNMTWARSVPFFYTGLLSKVEMYGTTMELVGNEEFRKMTEKDLQKSCMYYTLTDNVVPIYGFGNKLKKYEIYPNVIRPGVWDWSTLPNSDGARLFMGTTYVTMSDNENALIIVTQWTNGMRGFSIGSVKPRLPEDFLIKAKKHLVNGLGFDEQYFLENNYDMCTPFQQTANQVTNVEL